MKRQVLSIFLAVVLLLSLCLVMAAPAGAADPTTIASSTMIFGGTLDPVGNGYTGVLPLIDESIGPLGDGETGFDVYARNGAMPFFTDDRGLVTPGSGIIIVDHDAYPTWPTDVPDQDYYALILTADRWELVYNENSPRNWGVSGCVPMSGTMNWMNMYAAETDVGYSYGDSDGPVGTNSGVAAANGGGEACWDMDWIWGTDVVPLQFPGFAVDIVDVGDGTYQVTMTPAPGPPGMVWVDDDAPAGWYNGTTNFATIQEGVTAVAPGGTIYVAEGTYSGAIIDKHVKVYGQGGGISVITSGVPYNVGASLTTAFRLDSNADGTEISGFTINNNQPSSFYFAVFARGADNVIINSLEVNDTVQGISNWGGSNWHIANNVITDTVAAGGGGIGIYLGARPQNNNYTSSLPVCSNNLVENNIINATATAEGYSCPGIALTLDTRWDGYYELDGFEDVANNTIRNNTITASGANNGIGIEVGVILGDGEDDALRTDPAAIAALMAAAAVHDNLIEGNSIDGPDSGVYLYNVTDVTVTGNQITNCVSQGVYIEHGHFGVLIRFNDILGNGGAGGYGVNNDTATPVDAENNWWGNANGPLDPAGTIEVPNPADVSVADMLNIAPAGNLGNAASEGVDYYPWLMFSSGPSSGGVGMQTTVPQIVAISVNPGNIDFGTLYPGDTSGVQILTVTNIGTVTVNVDADLEPTGTVFDNLTLDALSVDAWSITGLPHYGTNYADVNAQLYVPSEYEAQGPENALLVFEAY
jgi:hypothetical protein